MAYTHSKYEAALLASGGTRELSVSAVGHKGSFHPLYMPHLIRAVSVALMTTAAITTAVVISVRKNTTAGAASTTGQQQDTITIPTTAVQGKVFYIDQQDIEVGPGDSLDVQVTTASGVAATRVVVNAYVEPRWEVPGNTSDMTESA